MIWPIVIAYEYCVLGSGAAALSVVGNLVGKGLKKDAIVWQSDNFSLNSFEYDNEPVGDVKRMITEFFKANNGFKGLEQQFKSVDAIMKMEDDAVLSSSDLDYLSEDLTLYLKSKVTSLTSDLKKIRYNEFSLLKKEFNVLTTNRLFPLSCQYVYIASGSPKLTKYGRILNVITKNKLETRIVDFDSSEWKSLRPDGKIGIVYGFADDYSFKYVSEPLIEFGFQSNQIKILSQFESKDWDNYMFFDLNKSDEELVLALKELKYLVFANTKDELNIPAEVYKEGKTNTGYIGNLFNYKGSLYLSASYSYVFYQIIGIGPNFAAYNLSTNELIPVISEGLFKYENATKQSIK